MENIKINVKELKESVDMYGMSSLDQEDTNLPMIIWISPKGGSKHSARIKVSKTYSHKLNINNTVSVSVEDEPKIIGKSLSSKDFELVKKFIILNKDMLLDYWNYKIVTREVFERLKPI